MTEKKGKEKKEPKNYFVIFLKTLVVLLLVSFLASFIFSLYITLRDEIINPAEVPKIIQQPVLNNSLDDIGSSNLALFQLINESGGIPISIRTETNWTQFVISLLFGSLFILWIFGDYLRMTVKNYIMKSYFFVLKKKTGRNILFIKHTERGLFSGSMIDQQTLNRIQKALIKFKGKPFDLILHTPGGEIFAALFISRLFKEYPGQIRSVIPMYAMSGGTLLALSTQEIHMAQTACLGPVDPQLGNLFRYGSAKSYNRILKVKGNKAEDQTISFAMMGSQYTRTIRNHLMDIIEFPMSKSEKKKFVSFLTSGDTEHAFALTPKEMQKFGVPVKIIKDDILITKMMKYIISSGNEGVTYL